MDGFSLRDTVVDEYKKFATSFTTIYVEDIRSQIERIYSGDRYWPEPLIQINPNFQRGRSLVAAGTPTMTSTTGWRIDPVPRYGALK